jgi:ABC-type nitrate/sulfonate/bicarbonate transport system substrate-binding protein
MQTTSLRVMWFVPPAIAMVADSWGLTAAGMVQSRRNQSSDEQFESFRDGEIDAAVTAMDNIMDWNRRAGPQDFRIVAQIERTTPLSLVARAGHASLQDLRNTNILVDAPDNGFVVALRHLLAEAGLESASYRMTPSGGVKERFDALASGSGDATLLGPPFDVMGVQAGLVRLARVQDRHPDFPGQGLVVRASAIERLRPALTAWLAGLAQACESLRANEDGARKILTDAGFPALAAQAMVASAPESLLPVRAGVELLIRQRREVGLPGADNSYETLVDTTLLPQASP